MARTYQLYESMSLEDLLDGSTANIMRVRELKRVLVNVPDDAFVSVVENGMRTSAWFCHFRRITLTESQGGAELTFSVVRSRQPDVDGTEEIERAVSKSLSTLGDELWQKLTDELSEQEPDLERQATVLDSLSTSCSMLAQARRLEARRDA